MVRIDNVGFPVPDDTLLCGICSALETSAYLLIVLLFAGFFYGLFAFVYERVTRARLTKERFEYLIMRLNEIDATYERYHARRYGEDVPCYNNIKNATPDEIYYQTVKGKQDVYALREELDMYNNNP